MRISAPFPCAFSARLRRGVVRAMRRFAGTVSPCGSMGRRSLSDEEALREAKWASPRGCACGKGNGDLRR